MRSTLLCHDREIEYKSFGSKIATNCISNLCIKFEQNNQPFSKNPSRTLKNQINKQKKKEKGNG